MKSHKENYPFFEAEVSIIASLILDPSLFELCKELKAENFSDSKNKVLFKLLRDWYCVFPNKNIDLVVLAYELADIGMLNLISKDYLKKIPQTIANTDNFEIYVDCLLQSEGIKDEFITQYKHPKDDKWRVWPYCVCLDEYFANSMSLVIEGLFTPIRARMIEIEAAEETEEKEQIYSINYHPKTVFNKYIEKVAKKTFEPRDPTQEEIEIAFGKRGLK